MHTKPLVFLLLFQADLKFWNLYRKEYFVEKQTAERARISLVGTVTWIIQENRVLPT